MDLWTLADLATPWCVRVVATLRIADHIEAGRTGIDELAAAAGADADFLWRVLRHLVGRGLFTEPAPGRFALNEPARGLLDDSARLGLDLDGFGGRMAHAWGTLLSAVRTGAPAYQEAFGRPYWDDLDAHPDIAERFDAMMGPGHGEPDADVLVHPGDWPSIRTVVDVGGGTGSLLAAVLRAHPNVRGILVDLPRTVARSGPVFEAAGVASRATAVGQSFFDPLPAGHDLYLMQRVLPDWPDRAAATILARCAEAARPHGRVVILSGVHPDSVGGADPALLMLVLVGGRERTLAEFGRLAERAGLEVTASGRHPSGRHIVECRPAAARV